MKKLLLLPLAFLLSCKSTEKCDAYTQNVSDTLIFEPMHLHSQHNILWYCDEFEADTVIITHINKQKNEK